MQQEPKPGYDAASGVDVAAGSRNASATVGAFPSVQPSYANRGKPVWKRKAGVSSSELASRPLTDSEGMWRKGEAVTAGETATKHMFTLTPVASACILMIAAMRSLAQVSDH